MKILKAPDRVKLMQLLDLPAGAHQIYDELAGSLFGDTFEEVVRFALISWLYEHHAVALAEIKGRFPTMAAPARRAEPQEKSER